MRVIAGSARGRRLVAPAGDATRPTSDRVRESLLNALVSQGAVAGATVLDLYCGSGALGIEALSRGAAHVTFVDRDPAAIDATRANLAACGLEDRATVTRDDVETFLDTASPVDLALLDPPYSFDGWGPLLGRIDADWLALESNRAIDPPAGFAVVRAKRYGSTWTTVARRGPMLPSVERPALP